MKRLLYLSFITSLLSNPVAAVDLVGQWNDIESGDYNLDFEAGTFSDIDAGCDIKKITRVGDVWNLDLMCLSDASPEPYTSTIQLFKYGQNLRMALQADTYVEFQQQTGQ
jgi:hypothetical protein